MVNGGLRGTAWVAVGTAGVDAILDDIEIEATQLIDAEVVQFLVDGVQAVLLVQTDDLILQGRGAIHDPAVEPHHVALGDGVLRRVETVEVRQHEARRVADATVGIGGALEDLVGNAHLAAEIRCRHPQAQHVRTQLVDHFLRSDHIAQRLGHLVALRIHRETVGEHRLVGRIAVDGDGGLQR